MPRCLFPVSRTTCFPPGLLSKDDRLLSSPTTLHCLRVTWMLNLCLYFVLFFLNYQTACSLHHQIVYIFFSFLFLSLTIKHTLLGVPVVWFVLEQENLN